MSSENITRKLLLITVTLAVALLWSISITISTDIDRGVIYKTSKIKEKYVMPKLRNI